MFVNHNVILLVREFMINEARSCERRGTGTVPVVLILACRTRGFIGKADI